MSTNLTPHTQSTGEPTSDRNGDPIVGAVLDIIDDKHSRYAVAVAVAEYVRTEAYRLAREVIGEDEPRPPISRYKTNLTRTERTTITRNVLKAEQRQRLQLLLQEDAALTDGGKDEKIR